MDLSFQQLQKEGYLYIEYYQFVFTCLKNKRIPFRMLQYNPESDCQTFIIFSETQNGQVVTRHFRFNKADAVFFRAWVASDFPSLEFEIVDSPDETEIKE